MSVNTTVLIVEDDCLQAHLLKIHLANLNYEVLAISDTGEEAIKLATELKPKLIMMDISLAGKIDGIEAVRRIYEVTASISIIFLTSNSDPASKKRAESVGFNDFLIKPVNNKMLNDSLNRILS